MQVSVIVSTFNSPEWLEKVFWGYIYQTHQKFDIIVADDGSDDRTRDLVARYNADTDLSIEHVWQRDLGFRKCRILNKAILAARNEYIVITDGDCIPRADFLAQHCSAAQKDHYLSGSYFKLPLSTSQQISRDDVASGRCFDLLQHGAQISCALTALMNAWDGVGKTGNSAYGCAILESNPAMSDTVLSVFI